MSLQCKLAANLLQVRPMVTSRLALTCCKLVPHLHTCRDKFAVGLQTCSASLLQTKIAIWVTLSFIDCDCKRQSNWDLQSFKFKWCIDRDHGNSKNEDIFAFEIPS
ncbi:hypothetical protein AVEN_135212-1 [Araneus ventricosus]|uniref:Uncharacterized protein n=1 Tax=Araneus ventricosus TaxID=182803 RepID=A0A4Y2CMX5_ARAVE|nr:hypothetical protein AVEN_114209-1 [Araneus ventricosus]GBM05048.1 hypothetical protein AVEN_135212-1 [Araneus ventricosus]